MCIFGDTKVEPFFLLFQVNSTVSALYVPYLDFYYMSSTILPKSRRLQRDTLVFCHLGHGSCLLKTFLLCNRCLSHGNRTRNFPLRRTGLRAVCSCVCEQGVSQRKRLNCTSSGFFLVFNFFLCLVSADLGKKTLGMSFC